MEAPAFLGPSIGAPLTFKMDFQLSGPTRSIKLELQLLLMNFRLFKSSHLFIVHVMKEVNQTIGESFFLGVHFSNHLEVRKFFSEGLLAIR